MDYRFEGQRYLNDVNKVAKYALLKKTMFASVFLFLIVFVIGISLLDFPIILNIFLSLLFATALPTTYYNVLVYNLREQFEKTDSLNFKTTTEISKDLITQINGKSFVKITNSDISNVLYKKDMVLISAKITDKRLLFVKKEELDETQSWDKFIGFLKEHWDKN